MIAAAAIKRSGARARWSPRRGRARRRGRRHARRQAPLRDAHRPRADARPSSASPSRTSCASSSAASCGRGSRCAAAWPTGPCPRPASIPSPRWARCCARCPRSSAGCGGCASAAGTCGRPTVTPTVVQAPVAGRAAVERDPRRPQATLDIRLTPGPDARRPSPPRSTSPASAPRRRARASRRVAAGQRLPAGHARRASEPLVRAMVRGVRQATGRAPRFGGVPGSTDGTILRMTLGIPIVTCGPGDRLIPHQVDEHVEVAELVDAARIYVASALNFLKRVSEPPAPARDVEAFPVEHEGERCVALRDPAGYTDAVVVLPHALCSRSSRSSTASTRSPTSRPRCMRRHGELVPRRADRGARRRARRARLPRQRRASRSGAGRDRRRVPRRARAARPPTPAAPTPASPVELRAAHGRLLHRRRRARGRSSAVRGSAARARHHRAPHRLPPRRPRLRVGVPRPGRARATPTSS